MADFIVTYVRNLNRRGTAGLGLDGMAPDAVQLM